MTWLPALIGVIAGASIASLTQLFLFLYNARKDRVYKVRDALAEFGAAAFGYLDAQENLAAFVQRQMNLPTLYSPPADIALPEELAKEYARQEGVLDARERAAGVAYWAHRERLLASKAKLVVLTADRAIQQRVRDIWQRLIDMKPSQEVQQPEPDRTNPQFAVIKTMRDEVDQWLAETADLIPDLFHII